MQCLRHGGPHKDRGAVHHDRRAADPGSKRRGRLGRPPAASVHGHPRRGSSKARGGLYRPAAQKGEVLHKGQTAKGPARLAVRRPGPGGDRAQGP